MEDALDSPEPEESFLDDPILCVHCTRTIPWDANLCIHCKAPQNFIASADPYQRIHAEGFILRTAAEKPRSWWTVIGIWLLVGTWSIPVFIASWLAWQFGGLTRSFNPTSLGPLVIAAAGTVLVVKTTVNFFFWRKATRRCGVEG